MTIYDYDRITARAKAQIEKYGGTVYLKVPVDGKVNSGTGQITYNQISIPVKGIVTGYSTIEVNNISVLENDRKVIIATDSGKPLVNNIIEIDGEEYRILEVNDINPGVDNPVVYKLHVRSTSLAEDLDGFVTTLRGLNPGDIVIDPSSSRDYPQWVKLVSDYPEQDVTMLMEKVPYESYVYNDEAPTLNRFVDTQLYEYLLDTYIFRYSSDFYDLLQTVGVETRGYSTNEKITVLSCEELTGYSVSDQSSGKQIPYFDDKPFRRIAINDATANVQYWCRDYFGSNNALGIALNGELAQYSITLSLAIRACVFINNTQRVKLNDDGLTYNLIYD